MKQIIKLLFIPVILLLFTGCFKRDDFEGITIYTTVYPIEYIAQYLYGEHSTVFSIYPDGVIVEDYQLTDKQIKDYSKANLFIFNGITDEKDYVVSMFEYNKQLKIIDSTASMEYSYGVEELWLDPSNFLMIAGNIRTGFKEYISNHYLRTEIDEKYEQLKLAVSNIDASIKIMVKNASTNTIIVSSNVFKYLEKYSLTVISLEENENLTDKRISDAKNMINNGTTKYIFLKENEEISDTIQQLIDETNVQVLRLYTLSNISEDDYKNNRDYITLMNENLDILKNELYD